MTKINEEHGLISSVQKLKRTNHKDFQNCLFACYLSQMEPKKPVQALKDLSWVEEMQDELLQFKLLNVWTLVDLPKDKLAIVARIEAIRLFLAYASFKDFVVYQIDIKSAFLYGKIKEEVYIYQPLVFEDPDFPDKVYKVEKALYGLHQAPRACQDKYVTDILKKFDFSTVKTKSTLVDSNKALVKDAEAKDTSHLHDVKRIFRYLKGQPKLGLWYPRDSPCDLEAYFDSNYDGASLDKKSTIGEYVAAASCCGHVLWIQNQMLDYGFNLMNTKIYIDNESTIGIVKNLVFYSKTKHIEIRHYFIRDSYEKKLIQVIKIPQTTILMIAKDGRCFMDKFVVKTDETVCKEWENGMERAATTASSLEAEYALTVNPIVYASCVKQFWTTTKVKKVNGKEQIQPLVDKQKVIITEESIRRNLKFDDAEGTTCLPKDTIFEELARIGVFSGNVTPLFETIMVNAQEEVGEDKAKEETEVLDLEEAKTAQAKEIANLKKRVKKIEKRRKSRPAKLKRLKKVSSKIALVDEAHWRMHDADLFGVDDLEGNEVIVDVREKIIEKQVSTVDPVTTAGEVVTAASLEDSVAPTTTITADVDDELTLAKTLIAIKAAKPKVISTAATTVTTAITTPKAKGIVFHKQVQAHIPTVSSSKDKGKAKIIEPKKPLKKKDQIALDEEVARKLKAEMKAEMEEEERIAKEKDEANRAMIEE
uniref:Reverse transcriptase Ty1/copia-type domain-containing protein n=1 Tax=Tanacetum cinerariifolium TaxID=118510 RepID=A0A6L2NIX8_TANCI|nr:hypothetical protein [Tanacetum cinerariifolium]